MLNPLYYVSTVGKLVAFFIPFYILSWLSIVQESKPTQMFAY
jgi:phage shock protein PspC (stress-responsive transcriptional regulator)